MSPKIIIGFVVVLVVLTLGGVMITSKVGNAAKIAQNTQSQVFTDHQSYNWNTIPYDGGLAKHEFVIKNTGEADLNLANLKTSCTCTQAYLIIGSKISPRFNMHSKSDWTGIVRPGDTAKLEVEFDPTFHGPTGVGPIQRIVSVETSDPKLPYLEFKLDGVVIKS